MTWGIVAVHNSLEDTVCSNGTLGSSEDFIVSGAISWRTFSSVSYCACRSSKGSYKKY